MAQISEKDELDRLATSYDQLGTLAAIKIQEIIDSTSDGIPVNADHFTILQERRNEDPILEVLWGTTHVVPAWVDWQQIQRAQTFFARYLLVNCVALIGSIVDDCYRTQAYSGVFFDGGGEYRNWVSGYQKMIKETLKVLFAINYSVSDIQPGGKGHACIIKLRLARGQARARLQGTPTDGPSAILNDMQGLHTVISLFYITLSSAFQLQRIPLSNQDQLDRLALHRYVAFVMGLPDHYLEDYDKCTSFLKSMNDTNPYDADVFREIGLCSHFAFYALVRSYVSPHFFVQARQYHTTSLKRLPIARYHRWVYQGFEDTLYFMRFTQKHIPTFDQFVIRHSQAAMKAYCEAIDKQQAEGRVAGRPKQGILVVYWLRLLEPLWLAPFALARLLEVNFYALFVFLVWPLTILWEARDQRKGLAPTWHIDICMVGMASLLVVLIGSGGLCIFNRH